MPGSGVGTAVGLEDGTSGALDSWVLVTGEGLGDATSEEVLIP